MPVETVAPKENGDLFTTARSTPDAMGVAGTVRLALEKMKGNTEEGELWPKWVLGLKEDEFIS